MFARRTLMVGLLTVVCSGCGWVMGEVAEQKVRQEALEKQTYDDLDKLWKEARDLWDEYGCELPESPKADETFDCEKGGKRWLRVKSSGSDYRIELEHEVERPKTNDKGETTTDTVRERDWNLEFKLLERVDPKAAEEINTKAEEKGQKAKDATKDLLEAFE